MSLDELSKNIIDFDISIIDNIVEQIQKDQKIISNDKRTIIVNLNYIKQYLNSIKAISSDTTLLDFNIIITSIKFSIDKIGRELVPATLFDDLLEGLAKISTNILNFRIIIFTLYNISCCKTAQLFYKLKESQTGGKKSKKIPKKEILGKMICIYKIPGDRKEYVKHKGKLITVKDYKELMKAKKPTKPSKPPKKK